MFNIHKIVFILCFHSDTFQRIIYQNGPLSNLFTLR